MAVIAGTPGNDVLNGTGVSDTISGGEGNDILRGFRDSDTLDGGSGNDRMFGGEENDLYLVDSTKDIVSEATNQGTDTVRSSVNYTLTANVENLQLLGDADLNGTGNNALFNLITGNDGKNRLDGGAGNDGLSGKGGNDLLIGGAGNDNLLGGAGDDVTQGGAGDDFIFGEAGDDTMEGGLGNDSLVVDGPGDVVLEKAGQGIDTIFSSTSFDLDATPNVENLTLTVFSPGANGFGNVLANNIFGNGENNLLEGRDGDDDLFGNVGDDTLDGGNGNDILEGFDGKDTLNGGAGNDTYVVDGKDTVTELADGGTDTIASGDVSVDLTTFANVENVTLFSFFDIDATGNDGANVLLGNDGQNTLTGRAGNDTLSGGDGNDVLDGGEGNDRMAGGAGDDFYVVDSTKDLVIEAANQGKLDTVLSSVSHRLAANVENLSLTGFDDINGTGNASANRMLGNAGANGINGGAGNDTLLGGAGTDTLNGGAGDDNLTGGAGDDQMFGGSGNDRMVWTPGDGNDLMDGGSGIDTAEVTGGGVAETFAIVAAGAAVRFDRTSAPPFGIDIRTTEMLVVNAGDGNDTLTATGNLARLIRLNLDGGAGDDTISGGNGNDMLLGGAGNDVLNGGAGNDTLDAGTGNDGLFGGTGNDTYVVVDNHDIVENVNEGIDTVQTSINELILGANVENLVLLGAADINGAGNELANVITGNGGSNILIGLDGNDTINGGAGDLDILDGGAGNDSLNGGAGDDLLAGGTGNDKMTGGAGNDVYRVDSTKDIVIESANQGTADTVQSTINYTLGANLEILVLVGDANLNGTGNGLNNDIIGSRGSNSLVGGAGNDTITGEIGPVGGDDTLIGGAGDDGLNGGVGNDVMKGGVGNDTYIVDSTGDKIVELAGQGIDLIISSVDIDLSQITNVENVNLKDGGKLNVTGNALNNVINGNADVNILNGGAGNDILDGKVGADIMRGGAGNDLYIVNNVDEDLAENANEGIDTVHSTVIAFTLGANFENLVLLGTNPISGSGNELNNVIIGNSALNDLFGFGGNDTLKGGDGDGSDLLNGGTGDDRMIGEGGNDIYMVDSTKDIVIEAADQGLDLVQSSVSFTLGANLESLDLLGVANLTGTGNALNNSISGNTGNNLLTGGAGDDSLDGNLGNDTLLGGAGNDTLSDGSGSDLIDGGQGQDTITFLEDDASDRIRYAINSTAELANLGGDVISGFEHGEDKIDLSDLFDQFNINTADPVGGGFLKIEVVGLDTNILFDRNGGGDGFITLATLNNVTNVTTDDLITAQP